MCWTCRDGAVPLRCWTKGRRGDGVKEARGGKEGGGEKRGGKAEEGKRVN